MYAFSLSVSNLARESLEVVVGDSEVAIASLLGVKLTASLDLA